MKTFIENRMEEFEKWIYEQGPSLLKFIYRQVRNKELSEDLYQEVLLAAYLALPGFEERANIKSWIYKIALNKCRDYWRKEKTEKKFWEEKVHFYETDSAIPQPEESVVNKCSKEEMIETINELPVMYREPLLLFYFNDKTINEISSSKKVPVSTVKTRMRRAKFQLKEKPILLDYIAN